MSWIPETIIRALCWTLLHSLWQGLILAVVAGAVMILTKRARSATRYSLLAMLLMSFLLVSGYTFFRQLQTPASPASPIAADVSPLANQFPDPSSLTQTAPTRTKAVDQLIQYFNTHAAVVVVLWFIVFLARFVKLLSGLVYAQRIRHYGTQPVTAEWQERLAILLQRLKISRPVKLLESALIKVPTVVGWLKPVILVPVGMLAQLPADQVETILLHELAHISRRDYLFNLVQYLVDTLFFFNPALLWVSSLIRTERENCCDDVAVRETQSRRQLIQALLSFHEYQKSAGYSLAFAGDNNGVVKRVERIVHKRNHSLNAGERLLLMGGVLLLCGAFVTINAGTAQVKTPAISSKPAVSTPQPRSTTSAITATSTTPTASAITATPTTFDTTATSVTSTTSATLTTSAGSTTLRTTITPAISATPATPPSTHADTTKPTTPPSDSSNIDLIIRAHDHGVTTEFISALRRLGYAVNLEQAIRLVDHGVTADFLQSLQKEGYNLVPFDKAIDLLDHGVTVEYIRKVREMGFPNLTLKEAITLMDHGVTADFMEKWKMKTGSKLELNDYIRLRDAGIDPS